jgi:hypothetical protein
MDKLFHLHLPKTGGMALRAFMVDHLGSAEVSPPLGGIRLNDALVQWAHTTAISGHFLAQQGDVLPKDRLCLTVLRNPLERFVSEFNYNQNDVDDLLLDANRLLLDFDGYLESLVGASMDEVSVQLALLYPLGTTVQTHLTTNEKLTAAIRALDQFDLVGVKEDLQDFACMLSARMGWPASTMKSVNVSSTPVRVDTLTSAQVRTLSNLLEPEIELYRSALDRFHADRRRFICPTGGASTTAIVGASADSAADSMDTRPDRSGKPAPRNFGDGRCEITSLSVAGKITGFQQVMAGELMDITIQFVAHESIAQLNAGISIHDELGMLMFGTNSLLHGDVFELSAGRYAATFTMLNRLGPGRYTVDASLIRTGSHYDDCYHWWEEATSFSVEAYAIQHYEGRVLMDAEVYFDSTTSGVEWRRLPSAAPGVNVRAFGRLNEPLTEFKSSIECMAEIDRLPAGVDTLLQMKIKNTSNATWPASGRNPVHLSYQWRLHDSQLVVGDGLRTYLPEDVAPGKTVILPLLVRTPKEPGELVLGVSLVQEQVAWFFDRDRRAACYLPIIIGESSTS